MGNTTLSWLKKKEEISKWMAREEIQEIMVIRRVVGLNMFKIHCIECPKIDENVLK